VTWEDTIAAIATPPGPGGIGIIRISGSKAEEVARLLFRPAKEPPVFESHRLYHGDIVAPESGAILDEVLLALMKKPASYTGEDTVEIYCHGGYLILQAVFMATLKAGCRPARPGEFTQRAFFNNRLDLTQAEAVADMISAKTEKGLKIALSHLKGSLSEEIDALRSRMVNLLARLESSIDFTEEESSPASDGLSRSLATDIATVILDLENMLATYRQGKCFRSGVQVVIAGKPNVGKSSLLNALIGDRRAIVTPLPGTTRDFIEESIDIRGLPVRLTDTAGIRRPENIIEQAGIDLVKEKLAAADLVIILLDGSAGLTEEDLEVIASVKDRPVLAVLNKNDLPARLEEDGLKILLPGKAILRISAKFAQGLEPLKDAIHEAVAGLETDFSERVTITNIRHKIALEKAVQFMSQAKEGCLENRPAELLAIEIRDALGQLGEIVRPTTNEEVLGEIFSTFCIGK